MKIFPDPVLFEWDKWNIKKIFDKHGINIKEIEEIFKNKPIYFFGDEKHSQTELRHGVFGQTNDGRVLSVVFTIREDKIRVITARSISKKERRAYEKIKTGAKI